MARLTARAADRLGLSDRGRIASGSGPTWCSSTRPRTSTPPRTPIRCGRRRASPASGWRGTRSGGTARRPARAPAASSADLPRCGGGGGEEPAALVDAGLRQGRPARPSRTASATPDRRRARRARAGTGSPSQPRSCSSPRPLPRKRSRRSCWKHEYASLACAERGCPRPAIPRRGRPGGRPGAGLQRSGSCGRALGQRAVVRLRTLGLELLDRRHRLDRERHLRQEAAVEHRVKARTARAARPRAGRRTRRRREAERARQQHALEGRERPEPSRRPCRSATAGSPTY